MNYPELADTLYHGSTEKIIGIDLSKSAANKDFGKGFYTTPVKVQAEKFAKIKARRYARRGGFVTAFDYVHNPDVRIAKFDSPDLDWLTFILANRGFQMFSRQTAGEKTADIIIGAVANDAVGIVLNQLVIGTYGDPASQNARKTAIRLLRTERLYTQVFFATKLAVSCLKFKEAYQVDNDTRTD
jgi:hypothetical protein